MNEAPVNNIVSQPPTTPDVWSQAAQPDSTQPAGDVWEQAAQEPTAAPATGKNPFDQADAEDGNALSKAWSWATKGLVGRDQMIDLMGKEAAWNIFPCSADYGPPP